MSKGNPVSKDANMAVVMAHAFPHSIWGAEVGGLLGARGQFGLNRGFQVSWVYVVRPLPPIQHHHHHQTKPIKKGKHSKGHDGEREKCWVLKYSKILPAQNYLSSLSLFLPQKLLCFFSQRQSLVAFPMLHWNSWA